MDIFKTFGTDTEREEEGTWVNLGGKAKILVARAGNKKYSRMLNTLVSKNQLALDAKTDEADDLSDEIMIDVIASTILLGWEGIEVDGKPFPYSVENAKTVLKLKDFKLLVSQNSKNIDNYRSAAEAVVTKK